MTRRISNSPSLWQLRFDVASARMLSWIADPIGVRELRPEVHLFLAERYHRLAEYHLKAGHSRRASTLRRKADHHYSLAGPPELPPAVAAEIPIPQTPIRVNAVSTAWLDPDDAA